ncbi:AbrB/MazE/SpoVT family DNA-binding domain-containing protein [Okeania sp. SIO1I7]|uniref:AbrB/MazE/SpoVT family DNA-binding domain-containing protein n=1 Tax=Okeania sp. SIO1I7 TaxID=2607772 RepID=UPI0013F900A5|nr:AbrB/MazE/SpoVT family DNA-binding domain-containing protein [Okeania sp. SIO1I7]NET25176.1 AbrB/MazE/SpoVT family DNA-binding domain-containing protein [Okeania sp. SIO1I7]
MHKLPTEVHLNPQGELVIPVALWQSLGFQEGDRLIVHEDKGRLILENQETIKRRLRTRFEDVSQERSLADELIAERHGAGKKEMAE